MNRLLALLFACFALSSLFASSLSGPQAYTFVHPEVKESWRDGLPEDLRLLTPTCGYSLKEKTVYLLAELTGVGEGYEIEFILLGNLSDRAYEGLAVAWDSPSAVGRAVEALGVPKGEAAEPLRGLPMARGERFTLSFKPLAEKTFQPLSAYLIDNCSTPAQNLFARGFPYIGGMDFDDLMPAAILSAYEEPASLFGMPYAAPKSAVYGLFRAAKEMTAGEPVVAALKWEALKDGRARVYRHTLNLTPQALADTETTVDALKALSADPRDVFLDVSVDPSIPLAQVTPFAGLLLAVEEQGGFVIAPPKPGEIPLRAFLPNQAWRDRESRVFQPWEVEVSGGKPKGAAPEVTLCQILEDWSVEGIDPALTRKCYPGMTAATIRDAMTRVDVNDGKVYVAFFYVTPETTVGDLTPFTDALAEPCPTQWIFFMEEGADSAPAAPAPADSASADSAPAAPASAEPAPAP